MKAIEKILRKGYSVRFNTGYRNGVQTIVSVSALKNGRVVRTEKNKTALLKALS